MRTFIATSLIFFSMNANAWTLNSSSNSDLKGWENPTVEFRINNANCGGVDVAGAFNAAAKMWNGIPTSRLKVTLGAATTSTTFANPPTIYCETNFQNVTGLDQDFTVGAGAVGTANNRIVSGVLILNVSTGTGNISSASAEDLKVIMAHEIGHVLGLGHADENSALMYFDASKKRTASLSQDDIDGITYLYPRDEFAGDPMLGCGLLKGPGVPPMGPGAFVGFLAAVGVWWSLRHGVRGMRQA